jgi:hypothetical protein
MPQKETSAVNSLLQYAYWTLAKEVVGESGVGIGVLSSSFRLQAPALRKRVQNPAISLACTGCGRSPTVDGIVLGKDGVTEARMTCDHCGHVELMAGALNRNWDTCICPSCQENVGSMLSNLAAAANGLANGIVADVLESLGQDGGRYHELGVYGSVGRAPMLQIALAMHEGYRLEDAVASIIGGSEYASVSTYSSASLVPLWVEDGIQSGLLQPVGRSKLPQEALPIFIAKQLEHNLTNDTSNSRTLSSLESVLVSKDLSLVKGAMKSVGRLSGWGKDIFLIGERETVEVVVANLPALIHEAQAAGLTIIHIYDNERTGNSKYAEMVRQRLRNVQSGFEGDRMWDAALGKK